MQSDEPRIAAPQARKESDSKSTPTPQAEMQTDPQGMPLGRERTLLAVSKDSVQATPTHQAKLRSLD